jgi:hypothetical protein
MTKLTKNRCELVRNPRKKAAANQRADSIAADLPPGLARPALRALYAAGVRSLADLRRFREDELRALHGLGPKASAILRDAMAGRGIRFRNS